MVSGEWRPGREPEEEGDGPRLGSMATFRRVDESVMRLSRRPFAGVVVARGTSG
jgi:hypothetical protein